MLTLALLLGCPPPDDPSKPADPRDTGTAGCDADGDGACAPEDCDDHDPTAHPAAEEVCGDGVDNDCDGALDEGAGAFWTDADGDGWGTDPASPCPGEGLVENADDCDDADATVSPDAQEVCDGVDQDCDGAVDDGVLAPWFRDADGDGLGDPAVTTEACEAPDGWVADDTDCDDTRALASETCNELDD
ncbi:MAG: putative metal-binding motif-containing protein, partial [Myxococcota bacterium]